MIPWYTSRPWLCHKNTFSSPPPSTPPLSPPQAELFGSWWPERFSKNQNERNWRDRIYNKCFWGGKKAKNKKVKQNNERPTEHNHYSSHMVSVSDGCLQGIDSCLELLIDQTQQSPGGEAKEDEGRNGAKGGVERGREVFEGWDKLSRQGKEEGWRWGKGAKKSVKSGSKRCKGLKKRGGRR